jgi:murein L,D-transpeptidase YcbB/YkuD
MRGKYSIRVYGETYLAFSTKEMLEWITLFQKHGIGSQGDAFVGATTMSVLRIATHRRTLDLTTTAKRIFSRPQPTTATKEEV